MTLRRCAHAGTWYTSEEASLSHQLNDWLSQVPSIFPSVRAIIVPHAGYRYSGSCAAYGYKQIQKHIVKRIFILGPSHHLDIGNKCALSTCRKFATPFYDLKIDDEVYEKLKKTKLFCSLQRDDDEAEHSIEMQLPYLAWVMKDFQDQFTIVPIMVGTLSSNDQERYGELLAPFLNDPSNFFIISSDFCHWGSRFRYSFYNEADGQIWKSIEKLDHMAMEIIERMDPLEFQDYLEKYRNTICGRRGIGIFLYAIKEFRKRYGSDKSKLKFINYAQSNRCQSMNDSSVSYASAYLSICE